MPPLPRVAVVGAGISGLVCARLLTEAGATVQLFEKSRGVGGRMATRRTPQGEIFDHGAQYFTARDVVFQRYIDQWVREGIVAPWAGRIVELNAGTLLPCEPITRYVGVPGMTAIAKRLASELTVTLDTRAASAHRTAANSWELTNEQGQSLGEFEVILAAVPPLQAAPLMAASGELTALIAAVNMQPCWAVMATFSSPLCTPFDGAFVNDAPLAWLARNSSKPGRPIDPETWVLHAASAWSDEHLEEPADGVISTLLAVAKDVYPAANWQPSTAIAHRWRYAIPAQPLTKRSFYDQQNKLGICGDWCGGPRVEGAFLSGVALAEQVLRSLV
ncbi:MAG TPA: FAD-dependent oxidoreductase [Pirellulaceae bacterium]|nr:FAD-dependent oxidoreductase [Pirellulaceae bacterium]